MLVCGAVTLQWLLYSYLFRGRCLGTGLHTTIFLEFYLRGYNDVHAGESQDEHEAGSIQGLLHAVSWLAVLFNPKDEDGVFLRNTDCL
jgi:hypothetical protein